MANSEQYVYSNNLAIINVLAALIKNPLLFADNNYQNISSSMVKEVLNLGKPVTKYVNPIVEEAMIKKLSLRKND